MDSGTMPRVERRWKPGNPVERGPLTGLPRAEAWEVYLKTRPRFLEIAGGGVEESEPVILTW